jgi:predicted nucleic acid-binding protein
MIIYADTSALVKLFVTEAHSDATRLTFQTAQALGTGLLTRAELGSALARGARRGLLSEAEAEEARQWLHRVWPTWIHITMNENLVSRAESLAWDYKLRGYDAVHLPGHQTDLF